jgi:hypothetical protein
MQDTTMLDLDSILDATLDSVKDVPDFVTPPTGIYMLSITKAELAKGLPAKAGKEATPPRLNITYRVDSTLECDTMPVADGSLFSEGFQTTEQGLEYFKKQAKKLLNADSVDGIPIRNMLEALPELSSFKAKIVTKSNAAGYENARITPIYEAAS